MSCGRPPETSGGFLDAEFAIRKSRYLQSDTKVVESLKVKGASDVYRVKYGSTNQRRRLGRTNIA